MKIVSRVFVFILVAMFIICGLYFNVYGTETIDSEQKDYILIDYDVSDIDNSFKSYMDFRTLDDENSIQYEIQNLAYTDDEGFRKIDDDYLIALGTFYTEQCNEKFEIELSDGRIFTALTGDIKADVDTNSTHQYHTINGNMIEFIVDTDLINELSMEMGDMSYSGFEGKIIRISKYIL